MMLVPLANEAEIIALCKNDFDDGGVISPKTLEGKISTFIIVSPFNTRSNTS